MRSTFPLIIVVTFLCCLAGSRTLAAENSATQPNDVFTDESSIVAVSTEEPTGLLKAELTLSQVIFTLMTFRKVTREDYLIYAHTIAAQGSVTLKGGVSFDWRIEPGYAAKLVGHQGEEVYLLSPRLRAATKRPATTQSVSLTISEPAASHRFNGPVFTLQNIEQITSLTEIVVTDGPNAMHAAKNGIRIDAANLETVLKSGTPVPPDDKLIDDWQYAPWCHATFEVEGRKWRAAFFLGGLGELTDDAGRRAVFKFKIPSDDRD